MLDIDWTAQNEKGYRLLVDGIEYYQHSFRHGAYSDLMLFERIISHGLTEVGRHFDSISYLLDNEDKRSIMIDLSIKEALDESTIKVAVFSEYALTNWTKPFPFHLFSKTLKQVVQDEPRIGKFVVSVDADQDYVDFTFIFEHVNLTLTMVVDEAIKRVTDLENKALLMLTAQASEGFTSIFNFPDTIKSSCKQYLIYFSQFLQDLGINADTEIKEQTQATLFTVVPKDKTEALDRIKEALEAYINAPGLSELELSQFANGDIAGIQFQANIMHLKSQLMFAQSAIQMKDATIQALQLSNYQLNNIVDSNAKAKNDEEDIIKGVISVTKLEGKGFNINFPEILRKLKRFRDK